MSTKGASPSSARPTGDAASGTDGHPGLVALVGQLGAQITRLIKAEIALLRKEITTRITQALVALVLLVVAGVLALYALGILLQAAVLGLATVVPEWLAALIVGVVLLALVGVLVAIAKKRLDKGVPPTPTTTVESIKADVETIKEGVKG